MTKRRVGILTGGGDVPPLNAVLAAARAASIDAGFELVGFINGWQGVVENRSVILNRITLDPGIGGTFLKSSRINLAQTPERVTRARETLAQNRLEGLIVVGGEDTLSNALRLPDFPQVLIAKTVDNDVGAMPEGRRLALPGIVNYFTLGYPTALAKIASFAGLRGGLRTTAYSHERIVILESMGMHAGWLALGSSLGHPDFIIIPEFPLDYDLFKEKVVERYQKEKNLIVVVAEGARWAGGRYISADEGERDDFGHPRFRGAAEVLGRRLKTDLQRHFDTRNVNFVNPSYLYRSGAPCRLDSAWARRLGSEAVRLLARKAAGSTFLTVGTGGRRFTYRPRLIDGLDSMERLHRFVDDRFYDPQEMTITEAGRKYLRLIHDEIPRAKYGLIF